MCFHLAHDNFQIKRIILHNWRSVNTHAWDEKEKYLEFFEAFLSTFLFPSVIF